VRRRYDRSLKNFFRLYLPLADEWRFYDNSRSEATLFAKKLPGSAVEISNESVWQSIKNKIING
jgi:predicted ABC-type ATPase